MQGCLHTWSFGLSMSKSEVSPRDPLQPTGMRPARRLSILITNLMLTSRSGTEVVVRDLALHLRRRGHEVSILAPGGVGELGEEIRANGALVFDGGNKPFLVIEQTDPFPRLYVALETGEATPDNPTGMLRIYGNWILKLVSAGETLSEHTLNV